MNRTLRNTALTASTAIAVAGCSGHADDRGRGDAPVAIAVSYGVLVVESADHYANSQYQALPGDVVLIQTTRDGQAPTTVTNPVLAASIIYTIEKNAPDQPDGADAVRVKRLEIPPRQWILENAAEYGFSIPPEGPARTKSEPIGID